MSTSRFEAEYPDLFQTLPPARRASMGAALNDDRLDGFQVNRVQVELLVDAVVSNLSDAEFLSSVIEALPASLER